MVQEPDQGAETRSAAVPVTVVGGALGAGKTTLINSVLRQAAGRRIAVIVNDFGALNIDADLIVGRTERTVSLENGCICCSLQGDLASAVVEMVGAGSLPDALVVEASGVANPSAVARVFQRLHGHRPVRLDSVAVVADSERITCPLNEQEQRFTVDQLRGANTVVLTKRDLVDAADYGRVRAWVTEVLPGARMVNADHGHVPNDLLLDTGLADQLMTQPAGFEGRTLGVDTWSFESVRPFDEGRLKDAIWNLPRGIVRAKGIICFGGGRSSPVVLQLVGRRASLTPLRGSGSDVTTRLVVIGIEGSVDPKSLDTMFSAALTG